MKVSEAMTRNPEVVRSDDTVKRAAEIMKRINVGGVPVYDGSEPMGILTDRDIAVRLVAEGKDPATTKAREIMSKDPVSCAEDTDAKDAARIMAEKKLRRLLVNDAQGRLTGIVSLGDLAVRMNREISGETIRQVSTPSEPAR